MNQPTAFRCWLTGLALCTVAVGVCVAYVDRSLALFFDAHIRHTNLWIWLDVALFPFVAIVGAAFIFQCACGVWLIAGHQLQAWTEIPFLCSWSAIAGVASEIILKRIFGRGWPDPTFIQNHLYGFRFLHAGWHWDSFPSGTATVSAAILAVLWILRPRWRVPGVVVVFFLMAAVVVMNYHWLSDVIAGGFLGLSVGWSTVRLLHPFERLTGDR